MTDDVFCFKSCLAKFMLAYIDEYKSLGNKVTNVRLVLGLFDSYMVKTGYDKDYVTKSFYMQWEEHNQNLSYGTRVHRRSVMRGFLYYISLLGQASFIPRSLPHRSHDHIPYIYTKEEIEKIFKTIDEWRDKNHTSRQISIAMPAILRLMYSTGTRVAETLSIRNRDVDFNRHTIYLAFTKGDRDRIVAMNNSVETVIQQYLKYRDMLPVPNLNDPDKPLFVSCRGKKCPTSAVRYRFHKALDKIGIPSTARIHDLRHTACVHAMVKLANKGNDIYCCLPMLSTYMGHLNPDSTEYYLRLTKEYYPDLIDLDNKVTSAIKGIISRSILVRDEYAEE